ncbi:hypothetical protein AF332_12060 [Sporosarcina globispora]|uniref:Uncharacterized protein n=1 Tax=Sporosarcina globispora TaxID=1459 RepID=A0A0M0GCD4_SPOGL|nr:hypothetical protein [Sporosarcina globispora]KON87489.1 hypothetical protein AF332_12060 [Sporosarcina globispora]
MLNEYASSFTSDLGQKMDLTYYPDENKVYISIDENVEVNPVLVLTKEDVECLGKLLISINEISK